MLSCEHPADHTTPKMEEMVESDGTTEGSSSLNREHSASSSRPSIGRIDVSPSTGHLSPPRSNRNNDELESEVAMATSQTPKRGNISPDGTSKSKGIGNSTENEEEVTGVCVGEAEEIVSSEPIESEANPKPHSKEPVMSDTEGSVSSVSAITFDCPNENNIDHSSMRAGKEDFFPMETIKSTISGEDIDDVDDKGGVMDYHHTTNSGSKIDRLEAVHEKVKKMQKENALLNETNLKLVAQVRDLQEIQERGDQNASRLNVIHEKVLDIHKENDDLRRVNRLLLDKVEQFENISLRNTSLSPYHGYRQTSYVPQSHANDIFGDSALSRIPVSPATQKEMDSIREKHFATKRKLEEQRKLYRELFDDANESSSRKESCPVCNINSNNEEKCLDTEKKESGHHEKENSEKRSLGLIVTRKFQRSDRKQNEMLKKMEELEKRSNETTRELLERKMKHMEDLGVMAELESANAQQKILLESLQRQVKEKDAAILNLESHIDAINKEMIVMRQNGDREKQELHYAYEELKMEASQLVEWLKKQLSLKDKDDVGVNLPKYSDEIAQAQDDGDLESLTPSERESLLKEINDERKKLMVHLPPSSRFQSLTQRSTITNPDVTAKHPESVDESTLTPVSQTEV